MNFTSPEITTIVIAVGSAIAAVERAATARGHANVALTAKDAIESVAAYLEGETTATASTASSKPPVPVD